MPRSLRREEPTPPRRVINLRVPEDQKVLIDRAAAALGKSRTEFMLDSARQAAEKVLLDQRLFLLDDAAYKEFDAVLDAPVGPTSALKKLLSTPPPWER